MTFFASLLNAAVGVIGAVKGKKKITEIAGFVLGKLPAIAADFSRYKGADAEERVRSAWAEFDNRTGLENPNIIKDIPAAAQERLFDGIKNVGLELSLWAIGYYGDKPESFEIHNVGAFLSKAFSLNPGAIKDVPSSVPVVDSDEIPPEKNNHNPVPEKIEADLKRIIANPRYLTTDGNIRILASGLLWLLECQKNE